MIKIKSKLIIAGLALAMAPSMAFAQSKSLEERVSELEANQSLNIFHFSGDLETLYDNMYARQDSPAATAYYGSTNYLRLWASLNVNADVSKNIKFYSRLSASKFMNNSTGTVQANTIGDLGEARAENGSQLYLERAYADVRLGDNSSWVFSFGRLPTSDGPFTQFHHSSAREGTYPALAYNSELDGLALSYNTDIAGATASAHLIYTPLSDIAPTSLTAPNYNVPNGDGSTHFATLANLTGLMLEYDRPNLSFGGHLDLIYLGLISDDLYINGSSIVAPDGTTTGTGYAKASFQMHSVTGEYDNILGSPVDFGVTWLYTQINNGTSTLTYPAALGGATIRGFGGDVSSVSGSSVLLAARYHVFRPTYLGLEYMHGGKNTFMYGYVNAEDLSGIYSTPGDMYNVYVVQNLQRELTLRVGYSRQNYAYTPIALADTSSTDRKIDTWYARLRLDF